MLDKGIILSKVNKIDDKLFISKILDKAVKATFDREVAYTDFLDPYMQKTAQKALFKINEVRYSFVGGYEGAERNIIVFRPDFVSDDLNCEEFFKVLKIKVKGNDNLSHRDYLGSLMSLGIKREKVGDILVKGESCDIIIMNEISEYLKYNLLKVGNTRVEVDICRFESLEISKIKVKEINTTVASLRLDCVSSAGFGISRSKAADVIRSERLFLNWEVLKDLKKQVKEGDTITVRGKGRIVVDRIGGKTRKDRINISLKKFV